LAFGFSITPDAAGEPRLRIASLGMQSGAGPIALNNEGQTLLHAPDRDLPAVALAQILSPRQDGFDVYAPATAETCLLLQVLPLPSTSRYRETGNEHAPLVRKLSVQE
jgi:hypothetical protein